MERKKEDKGWQIAETEKPAIIGFHKENQIDKIFKKKQVLKAETPKSKKESIKRFEPGFHFEIINH